MYVLFVPALVYAGRPLGIASRDVIAAIGPQFTGALAVAGVGFALRGALLAGMPRFNEWPSWLWLISRCTWS
jgi:PST family polysaccharide transporter